MNHADFIEQLGGATQVAIRLTEMTGEPIDRDAVRKWKTQGIAWKWRLPVVALAQQLGKDRAIPKQFLPKVALQLRGVA